MSLKHFGMTGLAFGAVLALSGAVMASPSAAKMEQPARQSHEVSQLLGTIRSNAWQVHEHAMRFERMTKSPSSTWASYDRQWNEIKPAVESMDMTLARLEGMQKSALSPSQVTALDHSKQLIGRIAANTHELRSILDRSNSKIQNRELTVYSQALAREAHQLTRSLEHSTTTKS